MANKNQNNPKKEEYVFTPEEICEGLSFLDHKNTQLLIDGSVILLENLERRQRKRRIIF